MSLENLYQKALKEITDHWDKIFDMPLDVFPCKQGPAGLNGLSDWLYELVKKDGPQSMFLGGGKLPAGQIYPKVLLRENNRRQIGAELQVILPDAPEVNAILPVLVTGYIMNRRESPDEDHEFRGASSLFKGLIYREKESSSIKMGGKSLFRVKSWDKMFRKVTYRQMTQTRMKKSLSYFGMLNLFLFLSHKMGKICNLTLSCDLFEEFTGYPGFCAEDFPRLDTETELHTDDDPLKEEISSYLDKLYGSLDNTKMEDKLNSINMSYELTDLLVDMLCEGSEDSGESDGEKNGETQIKDGSLLDMALEQYIMFTIEALIRRDRESAVQRGEIFTEKDLSKNKWAESIWTDMILMFFREPFDWNENQETAK